jgi:hypothetical protein
MGYNMYQRSEVSITLNPSEKYLKTMRLKYVIYIVITTCMNLFFWYYMIVFCSVYRVSGLSWLGSAFKTLAIDLFVLECIKPLGYVVVRVICRKFERLR